MGMADDLDEPSVGNRLRELRHELGLSQKELAVAAGISPNAISLIERDAISPNVATLHRLAAALHVRTCYFLQPAEQTAVTTAPPLLSKITAATPAGFITLGPSSSGDSAPLVLILERPPGGQGGYRIEAGRAVVHCLHGTRLYEFHPTAYRVAPGDALLLAADATLPCPQTRDDEVILVLSAGSTP